MGGTLSHANNKLSFSFDDYVEERVELALLFREIAQAAAEHRQKKGTLQVINGASGVTAGVAGAVALALSPVTFGASVPAAAILATAIVSNSLAAASLTSSVASYGFGRGGDEAIEHRLQNLQCIMDSISKKDEEINNMMKELEEENVEPVVKACQQLRSNHVDTEKEKRPVHVDLPLSVLKSQGIFMGTHSIMEGSKQLNQEEELETALMDAADALDEETRTIRTLKNQFKHLACVPGERELPRGRLTFIDEAGGYSRTMLATFVVNGQDEETILRSDSSHVLFLPNGAKSVKVHFELNGGTKVKKVDRLDPNHPWIKTEENEYTVDEFDFECGDGIDAVFLLQGNMRRTFVSKAWDFGRHPWSSPRDWEWWGNGKTDLKVLLPDLEARLARRNARYEPAGPCGIDLTACGSCFGSAAIAAVE